MMTFLCRGQQPTTTFIVRKCSSDTSTMTEKMQTLFVDMGTTAHAENADSICAKKQKLRNLEAAAHKVGTDTLKNRELQTPHCETLHRLQYELEAKKDEIRQYKEQHVEMLRRNVALQIDLETHDIHFADYADRQMKLEEAAVLPETDSQRLTAPPGESTMDLLAKFMADYASLEERYKQDMAASKKQIEKLQAENDQLQADLSVLEHRICSEKGVNLSLKPSNNILLQRINDMERRNALLSRQHAEMIERIRRPESYGAETPNRISEPIDHNEATIVARLRRELMQKNQKIAALRCEAIDFQVGGILSCEDPSNSDAKSEQANVVSEEQLELKELKALLVRKDAQILDQRRKFKDREDSLLLQLEVAHGQRGGAENASPEYFL